MTHVAKRASLLVFIALTLASGNGALAQVEKPAETQEVADFKAPPRSIKDVITAVENGKADETEVLRAKPDDAKSLMYYSKAAKKGDENAIKNRDMLEARIAKQQAHPH